MRPGALLHHALRENWDGGTVPERHALERTAAFTQCKNAAEISLTPAPAAALGR